MIKKEELRIGNTVWCNDKNCLVFALKDSVVLEFEDSRGKFWLGTDYENIHPIPLTKELLIGYKNVEVFPNGKIEVKQTYDVLATLTWSDQFKCYVVEIGDRVIDLDLQYLHQFENLIHALTGNELVKIEK
jgi:hypothetical protein